MKKNLKTNEHRNTIHQNLWTAVKTGLRGSFIVMNSYIKKNVSSNLTLYLKEAEKETKPKVGKRKEVTKITVEIKKTKNTRKKINEIKRFFKEDNRID